MYINVGGISAVRVNRNHDNPGKSRDQHLIEKNNNLERKKGNTLKWGDEKVGGGKGGSNGQGRGTNPALSPFPSPQCKK